MGAANTTKTLLQAFNLPAGGNKRLLPNLQVLKFDRLHIHISNGSMALANAEITVLFGTQVGAVIMLSDSTIWYEESPTEKNFRYTTPANFNETGIVLSVPVVAPILYDVIINNKSAAPYTSLHVSVLMQAMG